MGERPDIEAIRVDRQKANHLAERILERQFPHEREPDDDGEKALYQCRHCGCIAFFEGPCPIRVVNELDSLRAENERLREAHHRLHRLFDATNADRAHAEAERDARLPVIDGPLPDASRVPTRVYAVAIDDTECPWTVWNSEDRGWVNDDNGENWDADRVPVVRYIPFPPWDGSLTEAE